MPVFDEEFFKKLIKRIEELKKFAKDYWYIVLIFGAILLIAILFQQIILSFLFSFL